MSDTSHNYVSRTADYFAALSPVLLSLFVITVFLWGLEFILVLRWHELPESINGWIIPLLFWNIGYNCLFGLILTGVYAALRRINRLATLIVCIFLLTVYTWCLIALIVYFVQSLIPLGADLYFYSVSEITETIRTSVNIGFTEVVLMLSVPLLITGMVVGFHKLIQGQSVTIAGLGITATGALGVLFFYPSAESFDREQTHHLSVSKASFFVQESLNYVREGDEVAGFEGETYPLLRPSGDPDVLGDFLEPFDVPPNIVVLLIEGLGGSFMPPHAPHGGFTPHLDSLATESLYWTHFLSAGGRSFNVHPTVLASTPYGRSGFMEMGFDMPAHQSLIRILNQNDYQTSHFSGFNSSFDNINIFLDFQDIGRNIDRHRFSGEYTEMDTDELGFSWGYADHDMFALAHEVLEELPEDDPRLDIYFTLNLHEPFIIPEPAKYREQVEERLNSGEFSESQKGTVRNYRDIFAALLYTDEAVSRLMDKYRQRPDYENTLFVITGDHRIAPIPHESVLDRFYVPFLIYSPKLKEAEQFNSLGHHLQITPTLLGFLDEQHDIVQPDSAAWMTGVVDTSRAFRSELDVPLMRNKNQFMEYIYEDRLLSGTRTFRIHRGMRLEEGLPENEASAVRERFDKFRRFNRYVTLEDRIMPPTGEQQELRASLKAEDRVIVEHGISGLNADELFFYARNEAFNGNYDDARTIARRLLRQYPNYHDARVLIGRTLAWEGLYEDAETYINEVLERAPEFLDGYIAAADLNYWQDRPEMTLGFVQEGMQYYPDNPELRYRRARAYWQQGRSDEALREIDEILENHPDMEKVRELREQVR